MDSTYPTPTPVPPTPTSTNWRLYMELLSFAFFIFPFGNLAGPFILWIVNKDSNPEVDIEGKKVLNFNLSWTLWSLLTCGLGFFVWFVIAIISTLKAANREPFAHPLTLRFLK